jgi:Flp pilus assembly protein TadD
MVVVLAVAAGCAPTPPQRGVIDVPEYRGGDAPARTDDARLHADVLALDARMRAYFDAHVDAVGERERLQQLVRLFQSPDALGLRYNATLTTSAAETFRRREGNCLSLSALFVAAARHAGLDARFQDVELVPTWRQDGDVFVVERHINAVVLIAGEQLVVDFLVQPAAAAARVLRIADTGMEAQFFNNVGVEHLAAGDYASAYLFFRRSIEVAPAIGYLWTNLGVALSRNGQRTDAERAYRHALRLDRGDAVALSNLAALREAGGDAGMARSLTARVERLRNSNPYYQYWESERLRRNGDGAAAIRALQAAIALKLDEGAFHFALARLYLHSGALRLAERSLDEARRFAPDDATRLRYENEYRVLLQESSAAAERHEDVSLASTQSDRKDKTAASVRAVQ